MPIERVELFAVAVRGDLEERRARGGRGPQRATIAIGAPAGLIDMHRALVKNPVLQLQMRAGERVGGALADRIHAAGRERAPNRSRASSEIPRRETRCRAVNVTTAACSLGPNADPAIPSGNSRSSSPSTPGSAADACDARSQSR